MKYGKSLKTINGNLTALYGPARYNAPIILNGPNLLSAYAEICDKIWPDSATNSQIIPVGSCPLDIINALTAQGWNK
tara:strand:+ start:349 stop:579 length:231 start_codon:yes stop_codon:yes gene_type:complete